MTGRHLKKKKVISVKHKPAGSIAMPDGLIKKKSKTGSSEETVRVTVSEGSPEQKSETTRGGPRVKERGSYG